MQGYNEDNIDPFDGFNAYWAGLEAMFRLVVRRSPVRKECSYYFGQVGIQNSIFSLQQSDPNPSSFYVEFDMLDRDGVHARATYSLESLSADGFYTLQLS